MAIVEYNLRRRIKFVQEMQKRYGIKEDGSSASNGFLSDDLQKEVIQYWDQAMTEPNKTATPLKETAIKSLELIVTFVRIIIEPALPELIIRIP